LVQIHPTGEMDVAVRNSDAQRGEFELVLPGRPSAVEIERAMERIDVPALTLGIWSDMLYPSYQQRQIADLIAANGVPSEYAEIDSPHGHDAFLIDSEQVGAHLRRFIEAIAGE
jgi:homoserine acetyltransferase